MCNFLNIKSEQHVATLRIDCRFKVEIALLVTTSLQKSFSAGISNRLYKVTGISLYDLIVNEPCIVYVLY